MAENTRPGKRQKMHTWKMAEWKMHDLENGGMENAQPGKWQKIHTPEKDRKYTPGKCTTYKIYSLENLQPGNAPPEK